MLQQLLLCHVVALLDLLHVEAAKVLLDGEGRHETEERETYPEDEAEQVVNTLGRLVRELVSQLNDAELEEFIEYVHHGDALHLCHWIGNFGYELVANN